MPINNYKSVLEANVKYHDKCSKDYDKKIMKGNFKRVVPIFRSFGRGRFLDMGCGTGSQLKIAKKYFDEIYGIDCSTEMVKLAKKITSNIKLGDISKTPFKQHYFDFVNCFSVLHHCYEQRPIIKEAYRLLKKDGVFYSDNDPNQKFYKLFRWWLIIRRFLKKKDPLRDIAEYHQKNGIDPKQLKKEFKKIGFKLVGIQYHYPENPDLFTKILMFLNRFFKSNSLYYYFSIVAKK